MANNISKQARAKANERAYRAQGSIQRISIGKKSLVKYIPGHIRSRAERRTTTRGQRNHKHYARTVTVESYPAPAITFAGVPAAVHTVTAPRVRLACPVRTSVGVGFGAAHRRIVGGVPSFATITVRFVKKANVKAAPTVKSCGAAAAGFTNVNPEEDPMLSMISNADASVGATVLAHVKSPVSDPVVGYILMAVAYRSNEDGDDSAKVNTNMPSWNPSGGVRGDVYDERNAQGMRPQFRTNPKNGKAENNLVMMYPASAQVFNGKCTSYQPLAWLKSVDGEWQLTNPRQVTLTGCFATIDEDGAVDYAKDKAKQQYNEFVREDIRKTIVNGGTISADDENFFGMTVESVGLNSYAPCTDGKRDRKLLYVLGAVTGKDRQHFSGYKTAMVNLFISEMYILGVDEEEVFGQTPDVLCHESGQTGTAYASFDTNCYINAEDLPLQFGICTAEANDDADYDGFVEPIEVEEIVTPIEVDAPVKVVAAGPVNDLVARTTHVREAMVEFHKNSHPMSHIEASEDLWTGYDITTDRRATPRRLYEALQINRLTGGLVDFDTFVGSFVSKGKQGGKAVSRRSKQVRSNSECMSLIAWTWLSYALAKTGGLQIERPEGDFSFTAVEDEIAGLALLQKGAGMEWVKPALKVNDNVRQLTDLPKLGSYKEFRATVDSQFEFPHGPAAISIQQAFLLLKGDADYVVIYEHDIAGIEKVLDLFGQVELIDNAWVIARNWMQWYRRAWTVSDVRFLVETVQNSPFAGPKVLSWEDIKVGEHARIHFGNADGAAGQWLEVKTDRASGEVWVEDGRGRLLLNTLQINPVSQGRILRTDVTPMDSIGTLFMIFIEAFLPMLTVMGNTTAPERIGLNLYNGLMKTEDFYKFSENQFDSNNEANKWWELGKFQMQFKQAWLPLFVHQDKLTLCHVVDGASGIKSFLSQRYEHAESFSRNGIISAGFQALIEDYNFGYNDKSDILMRGDMLHTRWAHLPESVRVEWAKAHVIRVYGSLTSEDFIKSIAMPRAEGGESDERWWVRVADALVSTHSSKAAKCSKRVELPHADGVPNENAKDAGWLLPGMKAQLKGVMQRAAIMLSTVMAPGLNVSIPNANGEYLKLVGLNKSWTSSEFENEKNGNTVELADESWAHHTTTDREWTRIALGDELGVPVAQDQIIAFVNGMGVKNRMEGNLTSINWRLANTHSGPRVHVEWTVVSREDAMKGRSTFKAQYVYGSRNMVYGPLNTVNFDQDINAVMTSDSAKWDVIYSMLMVAGATFCNSNNAEYHELIARANAVAEGRAHSEYLFIEPTLVHMGVIPGVGAIYDDIRERFHNDFAETLWLEYADSRYQAHPLMQMKIEDVKAGNGWVETSAGVESDAMDRVIELGAVKARVFQNDDQVLVFGVDADGIAVNYLHRSVGYVGTDECPVLNVEIFERTTVLQSAGTTRQMSQNIRALLRLTDRNDPDVTAELRSMIDDGDTARYQYEVMTLTNAGVNFGADLGIETTLDVTNSADVRELRKMLAEGGINVDTLDVDEHEDMFRRMCKILSNTMLCLPSSKGAGKKYYWLPILMSYTSLKTNGIDDSTVASLMKQMLVNVCRGRDIHNYPTRINGMLKSFVEDNKNLKKFLRGRKCMQAKRVSLPNVPHGEAWIKYSTHPNSPYQLWLKVLAENNIPLAVDANGVKRPLDGWVAQSVRSPIPEGPVVRVRILKDGDPRLATWNFHWAQIALNTIDTYIDAGDYDGDGNFLVPFKNQALAKYCTTEASVVERLSARLGCGLYDAKTATGEDNESYARDHLAIKTWAGVEKKVYKASHKVLQTVNQYISFNINARELKTAAVGSSYALWNLPEVIHEIVMVMHRFGIEVPFGFESVTDLDGHMIGRATEIYEVYLGGYDSASYDVYKRIAGATNGASPDVNKAWECLPMHADDQKIGDWSKALYSMGANGEESSAVQLGALFNLAALIQSVENYSTKSQETRQELGANEKIFEAAAAKWVHFCAAQQTPLTNYEYSTISFLFAVAMMSFQVGRAKFEGFAKLRAAAPTRSYDEDDPYAGLEGMDGPTVKKSATEQTHACAAKIVRAGLESFSNIIDESIVLYQLNRTFNQIGGVLFGERTITQPDAVYELFTAALENVQLLDAVEVVESGTVEADDFADFVMYDEEAPMPEYVAEDDGYDPYADMPVAVDAVDTFDVPADMDEDFGLDIPAAIEDGAEDEEYVPMSFDVEPTQVEFVDGMPAPEEMTVAEAIEIPAPTVEVEEEVEEVVVPAPVQETIHTAETTMSTEFVTPIEETIAEETARLKAEADAIKAETKAIKERIASVKAARAKRDKAAAALEAARQAKAAAEAELAELLAEEGVTVAAPVVQEEVVETPVVEEVVEAPAPTVEPTRAERKRESKKLAGTRKSRRAARKAAKTAKAKAQQIVESIKDREPVKVDADSFFTPVEEADDSFDFGAIALDDAIFGDDDADFGPSIAS